MNKTVKVFLLALPLLFALAPDAIAGQGGAEFQSLWDKLVEWSQGMLGRILAMIFIIVGLAGGVLRGSIFGFVTGIASAVGLYLASGIISSIVSATLSS